VLQDWAVDNDGTVLATGSNSTNCYQRRDQSRWTAVLPPPLRDGQIGWYCHSYWTDM
jgi:hypothetical protein